MAPGDTTVGSTPTAEEFKALPATLTVRQIRLTLNIKGFRVRTIILVTTLLDPIAFPAQALGELHFQRWSVELHFREIKTLLRLDVLPLPNAADGAQRATAPYNRL
jgi:hypothetical protein